MSTVYRVYGLNRVAKMAPIASVAFIRVDDGKYREAWQFARGIAREDSDYAKLTFYEDVQCTRPTKWAKHTVVAVIDDLASEKKNAPKISAGDVAAIMTNAKLSDVEKLAAVAKLTNA